MLRVYGCITVQHDLRFVLLAGLICALSCYTTLAMTGRARRDSRFGRSNWLWAAATVAGLGTWTTHFVAMLAYRPGLPVGYDLDLTAVSVLLAILGVRMGLHLFFAHRPVSSGICSALGVAAMHFTGMRAVQIQADPQWDPWMVAASLAIGMVFTACAMLAIGKAGSRRMVASVLLLTLAICGLHFTAMAAVVMAPDPNVPMPTGTVEPAWLAVAVAAVTTLLVGLGLTGSLLDQHLAARSTQEAQRLRHYVAQLEQTKADLEATTAQLTTALDKAEAANLAKSRFLASISHELRTPLNAIIGFSEIISSQMVGPLGDPQYAEYAGDIHASGTHLLGIINDVLDMAELESGGLKLREDDIAIEEVVDSALRGLSPSPVAMGLSLRIEIDPHLPPLYADGKRLRQVLANLLSNAVKFTPEGGQITVSGFRDGDRICIAVADTGIGIAEADIPKAFESFGQVDSRLARNYEGLGLGLSLAKRLVELHGGTLELQSAKEIGTTVTLCFPPERTAIATAVVQAAQGTEMPPFALTTCPVT